ncbi:hypothetical protein MX569_03090 [Anoxybacillus kestanbolensis]|uniref:hypothetical protein n=1 Tax=Anoxybacillus kestanbolensis TaxID=227476 RepID=UPI00208DD906|nr:hypothetical protein [Anoxybacillus kestanbolensis]MCL9969574.1 hypothetical protein [Anoxybacillus kestanbolensis]
MQMKRWKRRFTEFPNELLNLGCGMEDLEEWIRTIETGITKTGRIFKTNVKRAAF